MEPVSVDVVLEALTSAAVAHGVHERELGKPDPDWPSWYAQHMTTWLAETGYELRKTTAGHP